MCVKELILKRKREASKPGSRIDEHKLALIIEGGGMRGVVSGAMTAALERLGLTDCFDGVYGSSAGAMAAAFFVAGTAAKGSTIYYEEINNRAFIDIWRGLTGKPILDLDFLVCDVFKDRVPLEFGKIKRSEIILNVIATEVGTGKATTFSKFGGENDLCLALKASACNPLASGAPIVIAGKKYWDASLSESIPVSSACRDGYTHFLVLRSKVNGVAREAPGIIEKWLARIVVMPQSQVIFERLCNKAVLYTEELRVLEELGDKQVSICPSREFAIGQKTKDRKRLYGAAKDGFRSVLDFFGEKRAYVGSALDSY